MAINWGSWEYSGGNGMRVGIETETSSVGHNTNTCTITFRIYTENQYSYSDGQSLNISGTGSWADVSFTNNSGGSPVLRSTKTYDHTYGGSSYGSSPGNVSLTATISGAYNGVTPTKTSTVAIPARPYAAPAAPDTVVSTRNSDSQIATTWQRNPTSGEPYDDQTIQRWDNVSGAWTTLSSSLAGTATSYTANSLSANRRYQFRVKATNSAGSSGYANGGYVQTTPSAPSGAAVAKATETSVNVTWTNNASGTNYDYTTEVEESVNGGAFALVATIAEGTASASRTGLSPGSVYQYRVRAKSTTGATTYSAYSTTGTIQLQEAPDAPTAFTVTRNSDTSYSLAWTNNPTTEGPYDSITVQRWDNVGGSWATVANLSGTATSLTDTATVIDRKYQWRIAAGNAAGSSPYATSSFYYTTPDAPTNVVAVSEAGPQIKVTWVNEVSYSEHSVGVRYYKNGVLQDDTISLASGTTTYTLTGIDITASYSFGIRAKADTGAWVSAWTGSNSVAAASPPNAPTNLAPNATVIDLNKPLTLSWQHSASTDGSAQTKFQYQHRLQGAGSWTTSSETTSSTSSKTTPWTAGTYTNGQVVEWQVRTWGVHANPSAWSSTATLNTSTTPTITLNTPGTTLNVSTIVADWTYYDAESTAQAEYELFLYDGGGNLLEAKSGADATDNLTLDTVAIDGNSYTLTLRVRDGAGLWSDLLTRAITADFIPPAEVLLQADLDANSGVVVLTLNPTADVPGTTLPATEVTIERQVYDPETETYGNWEVLASRIDPTSTIIDPTAPIHEDGHYRVTTFSAAPSVYIPSTPTLPSQWDNKWLYVSGGPNFDVIARMWANIEIGWKASRGKTLHYFAGRGRPVLYSGEAREKVLSVSGFATSDASPPHQWLRLAQQQGPVLLRAPGNRRIYGALSEVTVDRVTQGLHKVSFSIQEVYR